MKKRTSTIILIFIFLVGLCVLLYPSVSNFINQQDATKAIVHYDDSVAQMKEAEREAILSAAHAYNEALFRDGYGNFVNGDVEDDTYASLLDVDGDGIMGYITIDKLGVDLPIYHGTSSQVLGHGAGHLEGSSLPVGGESTHAVISGHRGLPSAKLFTDLDELEEGDTFTITVLDEILTYEVDEIRIVLPENVDDLDVVEGEDYVTLVTCTPYGVNTHRLLVRGRRIETAEDELPVSADALMLDKRLVAVCLAIPILLMLLLWVFLHDKKKKAGGSHETDKKNKTNKTRRAKKTGKDEEADPDESHLSFTPTDGPPSGSTFHESDRDPGQTGD